MEEELEKRIKRIYAAIGEVEVADLSKFPPKVGRPNDPKYIFQDFRGGLTDAQLENLAHSAIANVAHLRDHLRKWARQNARDVAAIDATVSNSEAIRIVLDLANREKHGGDRRNGGESGKNPTLGKVERGMTVRPAKGTPVEVQFGLGGPIVSPGGNPLVVLSAPIFDSSGKKIGYLNHTLVVALEAWEELLRAWGAL